MYSFDSSPTDYELNYVRRNELFSDIFLFLFSFCFKYKHVTLESSMMFLRTMIA